MKHSSYYLNSPADGGGLCHKWSVDGVARCYATWMWATVPVLLVEQCGLYTHRSSLWCPKPERYYMLHDKKAIFMLYSNWWHTIPPQLRCYVSPSSTLTCNTFQSSSCDVHMNVASDNLHQWQTKEQFKCSVQDNWKALNRVSHKGLFLTFSHGRPSTSRRILMSSGMARDGCVSFNWIATLSGKVSNDVRTGSRHPNLEDLKRRIISCNKNVIECLPRISNNHYSTCNSQCFPKHRQTLLYRNRISKVLK